MIGAAFARERENSSVPFRKLGEDVLHMRDKSLTRVVGQAVDRGLT